VRHVDERNLQATVCFMHEEVIVRDITALPSEKAPRACRLFKAFEVEPIAAASLGQVHKAVTWDGRTVVVKVQRPGLRELFDIDLEALRQIAAALDAQDENRDLTGIYQECADVLYKEIDYLNEVRGLSARTLLLLWRCSAWIALI
jgi:predicted unusual protein kinase regulating ubiquinone biosynthesis (AarF/ABC1/UbiB family)